MLRIGTLYNNKEACENKNALLIPLTFYLKKKFTKIKPYIEVKQLKM